MSAFLAALWGFLRSPLGRVLGAAVGLLAVLWLADARGYSRGVTAERQRWEARVEADARKNRAIEARQAAAGAKVGQAVAVRQAQIQTVTRTILKEVPIYVRPEDDRRCAVPDGFVRLHDAAAAARLPDAPDAAAGVDDAADGPALSAVAATVAENYGRCNAVIEQVKGWQVWAREVGLSK